MLILEGKYRLDVASRESVAFKGLTCDSEAKELTRKEGDMGLILGREDPEKGMAT